VVLVLIEQPHAQARVRLGCVFDPIRQVADAHANIQRSEHVGIHE
jgi:hypothetical protein